MSVEVLAAVVLLGGLVDLALLLYAMVPIREQPRLPGNAGRRPSGGGHGDPAALLRPRRRALFVAASGLVEDQQRPVIVAPGSLARGGGGGDAAATEPVAGPALGPTPAVGRTPAVGSAPAADPAPSPAMGGDARDDSRDHARDAAAAGRQLDADRGPVLLSRLSHASQAFGTADRAELVEATAGVEGPAGWARIVEVEGARLLRYRRPVTVLAAQVDGLNRLVDRLGDEPVRRLLVVVGDMFRREARASDWVASTAPGRFAVLLTETDESQAAYYAERVRRVCEPWLGSAAVPLGLAMGWSGVPASSDLEFALHRAEGRMHSDRRTAARWPRRGAGASAGPREAPRDDAPARDLVDRHRGGD